MNCDPIARWYRFLEYSAFGGALQRRRLGFVNHVADAGSVLILGDGDGRFTAEFVARNQSAHVESIDLSAKMLALAKSRVNGVLLRRGDARTIDFLGTYDLIVSHFFLDCFTDEELPALVRRVAACCRPGSRWVVSEFALPMGRIARFAARAFIRVLYFFFRIVTGLTVTRLPNYSKVFQENGFTLVSRSSAMGGLLVSELWALITEPAAQP